VNGQALGGTRDEFSLFSAVAGGDLNRGARIKLAKAIPRLGGGSCKNNPHACERDQQRFHQTRLSLTQILWTIPKYAALPKADGKWSLIASIYLPNGNPQPGPKFNYKLAWFERLIAHAATLSATRVPVVLAGDYYVVPTVQDIYQTGSLDGNALIQQC
jgi:hypothetical protein